MIDLGASVNGVSLPSCVINASGWASISYEDLAKIGRSASGAIVTASMTIDPQAVRPAPSYFRSNSASVVTRGFPNLGYREYVKMIPELKTFGKPVIASITGSSVDEFLEIVTQVAKAGPDIIQLDISQAEQPQGIYDVVFGDRPIGYNIEKMDRILNEARRIVAGPLGILLPGFLDPMSLRNWWPFLDRSGIDFMTLLPPINDALMIDVETGTDRLLTTRSENGVGMMSGPALKPIALAEIRLFAREMSGRRIPMIGLGGVSSGTDVFEYLLAGASIAAVSDTLLAEGEGIFARIEGELSQLLERKGYRAAGAAVGKLRVPSV